MPPYPSAVTPSTEPVLDALRLRRWALATLGGRQLPPPPASPAGWSLFLGREACALRLRVAAGDAAPAPLRAAADTDAQHILLLRAELHDLLAHAGSLGLRPIILKGGAALDDPTSALRAKDIDLLLDPVGARTLIAALDSHGWKAAGPGSGHHFAERVRAGRPPVEVHTTEGGALVGLGAEVETRAVPHPAFPNARLLAPADRVRQLVIHQTIQHSAYRGRLRDLLLLADALGSGPDPTPSSWGLDAAELVAAQEVIAMANALRRRTVPTDHFEAIAALWYGMDLAAAGRAPTPFRQSMANWVFDLAIGDGTGWHRWQRSWTSHLDDRTWFAPLVPLERHAPGVVRYLRITARALWLPPMIARAWFTARRVGARARAAVALLDH